MVLAVAVGTPALAAAQEAPGKPASFYGEAVDADGDPIPVGTQIVAVALDGSGEPAGENVTITVEEAGAYGGPDAFDDKLSIDSNAGEQVRFHVGSADGPQSAGTYDLDSGVYEQDLTFENVNFGATLDSIELQIGGNSGSVELPNGDSATATVTASFSNGTESDVSDQATIQVADETVASNTGTEITAESVGETTVTATYTSPLGSEAEDTASLSVVEESGSENTDDTGNVDTGPSGSTGSTGSTGGADGGDAGEGTSVTGGVSGSDATVTVDGEGLGAVGFTSQTGLDATVAVTERTEPSVEGPGNTAFVTGADITFEFGDSSAVETVRLTIDQSRLDELGVSAGQLAIYHLDETTQQWEELDTTVVSEDGDGVVLEAPSAGFSEYAVFVQGSAQTEPTATPAPDTPTPAQDTPEQDADTPADDESVTTTTGGSGPGFTVVLALLAVLATVAAARIAN